MSINRITVIVLYSSIYVLLIFPSINLSQNMLEIGSMHIYFFEIPLLLAYVLSFLTFLMRRRSIRKDIFEVYGLFLLIGFIGFIGAAMYATVAPQTILKDFRPILYWLTGIILFFAGHRHLRLKTLSWVVAIGLLTQFLTGFLIVRMDPSILYLHGFRLPGRSGWLTLFFVALLLMMITHRRRLLGIGKYKVTSLVIALIPLLTYVILGQNRTTWIALFFMLAWWFFLYTRFADKQKFIVLSVVLVIIIWQGLQFAPYARNTPFYLYRRLFFGILSKEGIKAAWEGNREVIYKSNLRDFRKRPILGNGFGHQFYYDFTDYGKKEDKAMSGTDNSFMNVLVKTGLVGLIFFVIALYKMGHTIRKTLARMEFSEEWLCLKAMVFVFPFLILISLNVSILYGYPEVMIFSLFFVKAALLDKGNEGFRR